MRFGISLISLLILLGLVSISTGYPTRSFMPWMCLERCSENITADYKQLITHRGVDSVVSFEKYDVGEGGVLVDNNFTNIGPMLRAAGFITIPMITTRNITRIRDMFARQHDFVLDVLKEVTRNGFQGVNIDFEPDDPSITEKDGQMFADFVDLLAVTLQNHGARVTIDIGHIDGGFYDYSLLANTHADEIISMGTYCGNLTMFSERLDYLRSIFGPEQLTVGLMTLNPNTNLPFSLTEMKTRFALIVDAKIQRVAAWQAPIPDNWWPIVEQFLHM